MAESCFSGLNGCDCLSGFQALKEEQEREAANKRNTLSHTPERKPEADSPRQSRSPLKNDKKEKVSVGEERAYSCCNSIEQVAMIGGVLR